MILNAFGSTERKGRPWDATLATPVITLFGGTLLDFRDAQLPSGETEVVVVAALGGVEVIVPADLPVLVQGFSALGGRSILGESAGGLVHGSDVATTDFATASGRRLRLSIFAVLGGVEVRQERAGGPTG